MGIVSNSVVRASYLIVDVLAEQSSLRVGRVAHLQAEHIGADEVDPLNDLGVGLVAREVAGLRDLRKSRRVHTKAIGVDNTAERVALFIITMRVELSGIIPSSTQVHHRFTSRNAPRHRSHRR